jgi:hypothetical protein
VRYDLEEIAIVVGAWAIGEQVFGYPGAIVAILVLGWVDAHRRKRQQEEAKARLRKELYGE